MKTGSEYVSSSPEGIKKVEIDARILKQIIQADNIEAFTGLFKSYSGKLKNSEEHLSEVQKANLILDTLKSFQYLIVVDQNVPGNQTGFNVLELANHYGSSQILEYLLNQVYLAGDQQEIDNSIVGKFDVVGPIFRINEFGVERLFHNPISNSEAIRNNKNIIMTLLKLAVKTKSLPAIAALVSQLENDIDAENYRTSLALAIESGDIHFLSALLNKNILKRLEKDICPMHMLCDSAHDYAILVEQFCADLDPNLRDDRGNAPLHLAIRRKHKHTVGKIAQFADLNCKDADRQKPIEVACRVGDFATIKLLFEAGADVHSCLEIVENEIEKAQHDGLDSVVKEKQVLLARLAHLILQADTAKVDGDQSNAAKYLYACFKGGGIKGLAYLAAIKEAIRQGLFKLEDFKGFAGTSAGSITAALLALKLPLERLEEIMKSKNFTDFFDYHDPVLVKTLLAELEKGVGIWRILTNYWTMTATKSLLDQQLGFCKGENFLGWIRGLIGEAIANTPLKDKDPANITFRDLHDFPDFFKELVVYGSNVNTGFSERYSFETTPDMCIADAVRISMSIPMIFDPHKKYIFKDGKRQLAKKIVIKEGKAEEVDDHDLCVDGGLFNNYPVSAFDYTKTGEYKYCERTIGFCLTEPDEHEVFEFEKSRQGSVIAEGSVIRYLLSIVYSTMFNQQAFDHQKSLDRNRTIYINTQDIQTTEFGLAPARQKILAEEAVQGVVRFMGRRKRLPEKALSSEVVKKLFAIGILSHEDGVRAVKPKKITAARILKVYAVATEKELPYLKTILNPNLFENGVTPLQIARAYNYKEIERRLLSCNANSDVPELTVQEINQRLKTDALIDSKNEKLLMMNKKERQRDQQRQMQMDLAAEKDRLNSRVNSLFNDLQREQERSLGLSENLQEANLKCLTLRSQLDQSLAEAQELSALLMQKESSCRELEHQMRAEKERHEKKIQYILCRNAYEMKLRDKILELNSYRDKYVGLASQGYFNSSGIVAACNHTSYWEKNSAKVILERFFELCPDAVLKSEQELQQAYISALDCLLAQLKGSDIMRIIENSGKDANSYRSHVVAYSRAVSIHLKEERDSLAARLAALALPAARSSEAQQIVQSRSLSPPPQQAAQSRSPSPPPHQQDKIVGDSTTREAPVPVTETFASEEESETPWWEERSTSFYNNSSDNLFK